MMLYPSMDTLLSKIDSRYLLVNVTAKRARRIAEIAREQNEVLSEKTVKIAINEVADGQLTGYLKPDA